MAPSGLHSDSHVANYLVGREIPMLELRSQTVAVGKERWELRQCAEFPIDGGCMAADQATQERIEEFIEESGWSPNRKLPPWREPSSTESMT